MCLSLIHCDFIFVSLVLTKVTVFLKFNVHFMNVYQKSVEIMWLDGFS